MVVWLGLVVQLVLVVILMPLVLLVQAGLGEGVV